jgi:hypothetical protein
MAIKVNGTEVISSTRTLRNITALDTTTIDTISANVGGGGGTYDFQATGALGDGVMVGLNSDGTVSAFGAGAQIKADSNATGHISSVYDPDNNKVIVVYKGIVNYLMVKVGTVSGNSISFGAYSYIADGVTDSTQVAYDPVNQKLLICYVDTSNSYRGTAVVGTVSGTSVTFGATRAFGLGTTKGLSLTYDPTLANFVVAYRDYGNTPNFSGRLRVLQVTGDTVMEGPYYVYDSTYNSSDIGKVIYDPSIQKTVVFYNKDYEVKGRVLTISGTTITLGTETVVSTTYTNGMIEGAYDSVNQQIVLAWSDYSNSNDLKVALVSVSGTTISTIAEKTVYSYGSGVGGGVSQADCIAVAYDSVNQKIVVTACNNAPPFYGINAICSITASSITVDSIYSLETYSTISGTVRSVANVYDPDTGNIVVMYSNSNDGNDLYAYVFNAAGPYGNLSSYIGAVDGAIASAGTVTVTVNGGVNEAQSGLTTGSSYFLSSTGTLTTTNTGIKVGRAIAADKMLIDTNMTGAEMNEYLGSLV